MKARFETNPNTIERMDAHYEKLSPTKERVNTWMMDYMLELVPLSGKILEVGCGLGRTLDLLKEYTAANLIGMEISEVAVNKASAYYKEIDFRLEDATDMEEENEYDMIINSQTLEHVDDPIKIIHNMRIALKPEGILFITTPYPGSSLDRGVKLHHWTIYEEDYHELLPGVKTYREGKNHLIAIYRKPNPSPEL
jgi:2-polyprenyl-3-methyl-5-hydroxy-6-metoxy-1,4-benzoquinol methylase